MHNHLRKRVFFLFIVFVTLVISDSLFALPLDKTQCLSKVLKSSQKSGLTKSTVESEIDDEVIILNESQGKAIINKLNDSLPQNSTTAARKEQKSVISEVDKESILSELKKGYTDKNGIFHEVKLQARDEFKSGVTAKTITIYGKKAAFNNDGIKTNLKLRVRMYVDVQKSENGKLLNYIKSSQTYKHAWLEIKVKHPSVDKKFGVSKFRIRMENEDIIKLMNLDLNNPKAIEEIKAIKMRAHKVDGNDPKQVESILDSSFEIGKVSNGDFIRPQTVISYERTAFKYDEPKASLYDKYGKVQYQITVDKKIEFYNPKKMPTKDVLNVENYLDNSNYYQGSYPNNSYVVEFKDPYPVANFNSNERSEAHEFFYNNLVNPMFKKILPEFSENVGKYGHKNLFKDKSGELRFDE